MARPWILMIKKLYLSPYSARSPSAFTSASQLYGLQYFSYCSKSLFLL